MRAEPLVEWQGLFTLRAPLGTGQTSGARPERARLPNARQPRTLGCGQHSGRGKPARGTPPLRRAPGSARSVHTAISGVHKLWTKLLIRCGGARGGRPSERNRPRGGMGPVAGRTRDHADRAAPAGVAQADPPARAGREHGADRHAQRVRQGTAGDPAARADHARAVPGAGPQHPAGGDGRSDRDLRGHRVPGRAGRAAACPGPAPGPDGQDEPHPGRAAARRAIPDAGPRTLAGTRRRSADRSRPAAARSTRWPTGGSTRGPISTGPLSTRRRSRGGRRRCPGRRGPPRPGSTPSTRSRRS